MIKLSIDDRKYLLKKGYDIRDTLTVEGFGEHAQVYNWLDGYDEPRHVLIYSREYKVRELEQIIKKTQDLADKKVNVPRVLDYMPLSYWTSKDLTKRELAECPLECDEDIIDKLDTIVVLEDKIEGSTLDVFNYNRRELLSLPDSSYQKLFRDAYLLINSGIHLDLNRKKNIKICDDQFYYLDIHMPQEDDKKSSYLIGNTAQAYNGLINMFVMGRAAGQLFKPLLKDLKFVEAQDIEEASVNSMLYNKMRNALSSMDFDIENRDCAIANLDCILYFKRIKQDNDFLKQSGFMVDEKVFAIDNVAISEHRGAAIDDLPDSYF